MTFFKSYLVFFILIFTVLGCSRDDDPISVAPLAIPTRVEGRWTAALSNEVSFVFTLNQSGRSITGSCNATVLPSGPTFFGAVTGTNDFPSITMGFHPTGYIPVAITGRFVSETHIEALLNESGFVNVPISITKE